MDTFVAIDTETTGLSFTDDRVIEFGAAVFLKGRAVHRSSFYIQTDVPNGGEHVNRITPAQIASGYSPSFAFGTIARILHKKPAVILAYNASFDLTFLAQEFLRNDIYWDYTRLHIIDPLVVYRHYHPFQPATLLAACSKYRIPIEGEHAASVDAEAAGHVWCAMKAYHGIRGSLTNFEYKEALWHNKWAGSFTEWAHKKGKTVTINEWPYPKELGCSPASEQLSLPLRTSSPSSLSRTSQPLSW